MSYRLQGQRVGMDLWCAAPVILQTYNARARRAVRQIAAELIKLYAALSGITLPAAKDTK